MFKGYCQRHLLKEKRFFVVTLSLSLRRVFTSMILCHRN